MCFYFRAVRARVARSVRLGSAGELSASGDNGASFFAFLPRTVLLNMLN